MTDTSMRVKRAIDEVLVVRRNEFVVKFKKNVAQTKEPKFFLNSDFKMCNRKVSFFDSKVLFLLLQ